MRTPQYTLCLLILVALCGCPKAPEPTEEPSPAVLKRLEDIQKPLEPAGPAEPGTSGETTGDGEEPIAPTEDGENPPGDNGAPDAEASEAGEEPDPGPTDDDPADAALRNAQELIRRAEFAEAVRVLRTARTEHAESTRSDEIREMLKRTMALRSEATDLMFAIQNLASGSSQAVAVAKQQLLGAPETGGILLCNEVANGDKFPVQAARLLGLMRYPQAVPILQGRTLAGTGSPEWRDALYEALGYLLDEVEPEFLARLSRTVQTDGEFAARRPAALLARTYHRRAELDPAKYEKVLGLPGAAFVLASYIQAGMASPDEDLSAWAHEQAAQAGLYFRGLHGQYFEGIAFEKLVHEQLDTRISIPDLKYPFPDGRSEQLSIRWTGLLMAPRAGTYTIYSASDDGHRVWVKDKSLIDDWEMHGVLEKSGSVKLEAGVWPIRIEHMQGDGQGEISVWWEGPGIERQLLADPYLTTPPWAGARAASPRVSADIAALENLYTQENSPMLQATTARMLKERAADLTTPFLVRLLANVRGDEERACLTDAEILSAVLGRRCGLVTAAFDELIGEEGAADALKAYVSAAAESGDAELAKWADRQCILRVWGLRGSYYVFDESDDEPTLEKLVFERLDKEIDIPNLGFRFKDDRTEYLGIRWTGFLVVPTDGVYAFHCTSDDGQRVWVDGKPVIDKWVMQPEKEHSGKATLTAGHHPFRLDYMQGMGEGVVKLEWEGPGIDRRVIPPEHFQTVPWEGMVAGAGAAPGREQD